MSQDIVISHGVFKHKKDAEDAQAIVYSIENHREVLELLTKTSEGMRPYATGTLEGHSRSAMTIRGHSLAASAERNNFCSNGWTFVHLANTYKWHISRLSGNKWTLSDMTGKDIAIYKRESMRLRKYGVLRIMTNVDDDLRAVILLTCDIVRRNVVQSEQIAA
ncbi:hypothetical protein COEREDRAFT_84059 [Coemansia reversa NRRL 1564]|uniref:Uncharacterized protein n=1 Tax=Coemansia reversa (strain ATCC 12441 / NRRL 1564) TaxID=763665 RepID=A0A2G5B0I9_COERN|nr:hypothetical protein COEREDRAFT_84059 [Coemansia reversa NRRL 1564]|eukprot:PIA12546.1 hypothetical protein COEREDRAFT_84059 [Coemansia reversa NRRL 1564]